MRACLCVVIRSYSDLSAYLESRINDFLKDKNHFSSVAIMFVYFFMCFFSFFFFYWSGVSLFLSLVLLLF